MNWLADFSDTITVLEGISPYLLMILVLVFILWRDSRVVAPAMQSIQQGNKTQLSEWKEIIATQDRLAAQQNAINAELVRGLERTLAVQKRDQEDMETRLSDRISILTKENAQLKRDLEHLKEQLDQKERLILSLHEELKTTKQSLSDEQDARKAIEAARVESEKKSEELQAEVKGLRERLEKVEKATNGDADPKEAK